MNQTNEAQNNNAQSVLRAIFDWVEPALTALICAALLFAFVFRTVGVDGTSMVPTLKSEDRLILTHMFYRPERGDIVVISRAEEGKTPLIKRVIAVEGDTVRITENKEVILNGKVLDEPYLNVSTPPKGCIGEITVPKGHIFVLGDNRAVSWDSRDIGPVPVSLVMGKATFRLWQEFGGI